MDDKDILQQISADYIRHYAYQNGNYIYDFMDKNKIGKSAYGALMDKAAKGKGVVTHRLYGHHIIYDFPINNLKDAAPFLEHLLSDLFTKQGLPIIPGEVLKDLGLLKCCDHLTNNWNFVNGFDILSATVAIYGSTKNFDKYVFEGMSINDFEQFANTIGVGALELAIAVSTSNPFLLIGGILNLTAGFVGMFNENSKIYFRKVTGTLTIEFTLNSLTPHSAIKLYSLENSLKPLSTEDTINTLTTDYILHNLSYNKEVLSMDAANLKLFTIELEATKKQYEVTIFNMLKKTFSTKSVVEINKPTIDNYIHVLLLLCKRYNIATDELVAELDQSWENILENKRIPISDTQKISYSDLLKDSVLIAISHLLNPIGGIVAASTTNIKYLKRLTYNKTSLAREITNTYLNETYDICLKHAQEQINDPTKTLL